MQLFLHTSWQPDTWRPTLERKHTSVLSVTILSFIVRSWKITCGPIQEMCDQCAHSCAQSQDLKVHKRKHTREKPFNCDQCDHTCALAGTLKVHTRETLRIWAVWLFLCSCFSSEATKAQTHWSLSSVTSATILALKLVIWKYTNANTQEKNLSTVTNVTTPVLGPNVWKYTSVTTQERNPSNVTSAVTLANNQVTCSGTRGRCTRQQKTCKNKQFRLYWTGHYFFFVHADRK